MAKGSMACPECAHKNATPEAGTKKITCGGCGMIIVMAKIYGEDWATKAAAAAAAPARPKIVTRRDRVKTQDEAPAEQPAPTGRATRGGRGSKGKSKTEAPTRPTRGSRGHDHGHGHDGAHHHRSSKGMSPALVWGSIAGILVVGVLAAVVVKNSMDEDAAKKAKEVAAVTPSDAPADLGDGLSPLGDLSGDLSNSSTPTEIKQETQSPAENKAEKKPRQPRIKRDHTPFPVDGIDPEAKKVIDDAIVILKDLDATTARRGAGRDLFSHRREAIPVLINELFTIKLDDDKDVLRGWSLIQELANCTEYRTGFENDFNVMTWPTEAAQIELGVKRRTTAIQKWHDWWTDNAATWAPPEDTLDE